jgi:hypothetical protein
MKVNCAGLPENDVTMQSNSKFSCLNIAYDAHQPSLSIESGQTLLDPVSGTFVHVNLAGDLQLTLVEVRSVELMNLFDLEQLQVVRNESGVKHEFRFVDGGTASVSFDLLGNLTELFALAVSLESVGGTLRIGKLTDPDVQALNP